MSQARKLAPDHVQFGPNDAEAQVRQLRRQERSAINVRAIVHSGLSSKPTLIRDVSDGGLGLAGADGLFPGCEVRIALVTGETKTGVVRWWLGGACGVQFHELLKVDDAFSKALRKKFTVKATSSTESHPINTIPLLLKGAETPKSGKRAHGRLVSSCSLVHLKMI